MMCAGVRCTRCDMQAAVGETAKSQPDFINKLKIVEEELDEGLLFLELYHEFKQYKKTEDESNSFWGMKSY